MKKLYTVALIALLCVSVAGAIIPANAQTTPEPHMRVAWQVANETRQFEHSAQHSDWVFGPQPEIWIEYDNGTDIAENSYRIEVGMDLTVNMIIPKSFLGEGNDLDVVQFWGSGIGSRAAQFALEYNATSDRWNSVGYRYIAGSEEPRPAQFIVLDSLNSDFTEETNFYEVVFAINYAIALPPTIISTGMQVIDTDGKPISSSWLTSAAMGEYGSPPMGLGMPVNPLEFSLPDYYFADIVDESNRTLHYADVNDTFVFRMMSPVAIGSALIPLTDAITYDNDFLITVDWEYPETLDTIGTSVLFDSALEFNASYSVPLRPAMGLKLNESGAYPVVGYLDLDWEWIDLGGGAGMWFPHLSIIENNTIDISKYYVEDPALTGVFDEGQLVQWAGYFTNETDLDEGFDFGGVIEPEMGLVTVLDTEGNPLVARPEISERQTLKLAFRSAFIEAFIFDDSGAIAHTAQQGDPLNLTIFVHQSIDRIEGSYIAEVEAEGLTSLYNISSELKDVTIDVQGSTTDSNSTHYWRTDITHRMILDYELGTSTTVTYHRVTMFEIGVGMLSSIVYMGDRWTVSDFEISLGADLTTVIVEFSFDMDAVDLMIDKASVKVGLLQNIRWWNTTDWAYPDHLNGTAEWPALEYNNLVASWTDVSTVIDVSNDILWSPRHLILGDLDYYTPPIWRLTYDGAIDLDGSGLTKDDRYYIKRSGHWEDWGNVTVDGMWVGVGFDPTPGEAGDEFWSENWMGVVEQNIWFNANETFYWYHASDYSPVNASELADIQDLVWADFVNDLPTPGYEHVSYLSKNWTLDTTTIPGLEAGKWSTTWFAWGTTQSFWVAVEESQATLAHFRAQYAGLLIFNDGIGPSEGAPDFSIEGGNVVTDEVTHYVLIDSVDEVELRRPFGATNSSGNVIVSPDTSVEFGITISDVDVTIYPLKVEHSSALRGAWDFRQSYEGAIGLNATSFDYRISSATITEMAFDISFNVEQSVYNAEDPTTWNNAVSFKVDQVIGDWTLHGTDNSVLEGRSLAVNFFGVLATGTATQRTAGDRPVTDSNSASQDADYYLFGSENSPYANVEMGGLPYTWGGDGHSVQYYSGSSTAPIGAFSLMYESAHGETVTNWQVDASMLFMTAGYEKWGGEDIICDPVFVAYTSAFQAASTGTGTYTPGEGNPVILYLLVGGVVALVVIVCVMFRRK
ncbi:MAG: hypothetical protein RTU63_07635 [Candidatus Thorarchaeota archaeon]